MKNPTIGNLFFYGFVVCGLNVFRQNELQQGVSFAPHVVAKYCSFLRLMILKSSKSLCILCNTVLFMILLITLMKIIICLSRQRVPTGICMGIGQAIPVQI